jgi:hypothetical protein
MHRNVAWLVVAVACGRGGDDPFAGSSAGSTAAPTAAVAPASHAPTVTVTPPAAARAGADAVAAILVTPPTGYVVNRDYPTKLVLAATPGLALAKSAITRDDPELALDDAHVAIAVHVTPTAGSHDLRGQLAVVFCTTSHDQCMPAQLPIAATIAAR